MMEYNPHALMLQEQKDIGDSIKFLEKFFAILFNGGVKLNSKGQNSEKLSKQYELIECKESRT